MKHLHNFDTVAEYEAVKDNLEIPYVVSIDESDGLQYNTDVIMVPQGSVGPGDGNIEGEYFLAKPNGRYWKFTFSPPPNNQYVDPNSLSEEQLKALMQFCLIIGPLGVACGAAVCSRGVALGPELRADGVTQVAMRIGGLENDIYMLKDGYDPVNFQHHFQVIWKECDIESNPPVEHPDLDGLSLNSYNLVEFLKMLYAMMEGGELTDDEAISIFEQMLMLIPATEEEYKAARREK